MSRELQIEPARYATPANVAQTTSTGVLAAANANRKGLSIFNDTSATLYVLCGIGASATAFTIAMAAASYYEIPYGYTGDVTCLWSGSGSGAARITTFT
jgi:hypothetical protein